MTDPTWVLTGNRELSSEVLVRRNPDGSFSIVGSDTPMPTSVTGTAGVSALVGSFGELMTGGKFNDVAVQFQYNFLNTTFDLNTPSTTGDGSVSVVDSLLTVASAATGTASVSSKNSIRYRPGSTGYIDFTASFSGAGTAYVGGVDADDGFLLYYSNGVLQFGYRRNGSDVLESVDTSDITLSNLNIYRIVFGYLGVASPVLLVKKGDWQILKVVETEGVLTTTHVTNPVFPITVYAENGVTVKSGSWSGGVIQVRDDIGTRSFTFPNQPIVNGTTLEQGTKTLSGTNAGTVALFRSKTSYKSTTNKVQARLLLWENTVVPPGGTVSGEVLVQVIKNPTLSGAASYTDFDVDNSIIEYDHTAVTGASVSYSSGGTVVLDAVLQYRGGAGANAASSTLASIGAERLSAFALPGDVFAIVAKDRGGNNVTVRTKLVWEELF